MKDATFFVVYSGKRENRGLSNSMDFSVSPICILYPCNIWKGITSFYKNMNILNQVNRT